jgi:hypothetical protein
VHPIAISRQQEEELQSIIKNQLVELRLYYRQNKHRLLPSGAIYESCKIQIRYFCILNQSNKAVKNDSRVASSRQNLNAVVEIYHEGKTLGSILCGLVYAHGCALLVLIRVYNAKKNPGGHTGYPENHRDSSFVRTKCGKRMSLTSFPNSSPRGLNLK